MATDIGPEWAQIERETRTLSPLRFLGKLRAALRALRTTRPPPASRGPIRDEEQETDAPDLVAFTRRALETPIEED